MDGGEGVVQEARGRHLAVEVGGLSLRSDGGAVPAIWGGGVRGMAKALAEKKIGGEDTPPGYSTGVTK